MSGQRSHEFRLDDVGIDEVSELLASHLEGRGLSNRDVMALRITLETALIRLRDHLGDVPAKFSVTRWLGRPRLVVRVRGERYAPLGDLGESGWEAQLMETLDLRPSYAYLAGQNVVTITAPRKPFSSLAYILIALVAGIAASPRCLPLRSSSLPTRCPRAPRRGRARCWRMSSPWSW